MKKGIGNIYVAGIAYIVVQHLSPDYKSYMKTLLRCTDMPIIQAEDGMVMAQDTITAQFGNMPRSSIATGSVDYILSPEKMGQALLSYIKHPYIQGHRLLEEVTNDKNAMNMFTEVLRILKEHTGVNFSYY